MRRSIAPLAAVFALAACAGNGTTVTGDGGDASAGGDGDLRYRATLTVLESPGHGPQLCPSVLLSLPPQCRGPAVAGWDWDAVDDEETTNGTTWGQYTVTGTWDGRSLTLTEPPAPPGPPATDAPPEEPGSATPCPTPPDGWAPPDPATTTIETQQAAVEVARALPTFAGAWVDQSVDPDSAPNDPQALVLVVAVTDDLAGAEAAVRQAWGGSLCVTEADRTFADLQAIQEDADNELGERVVSSWTDEMANRVELEVFVADDELRREVADRYGEAVELRSVLQPVP